MEMCVVLDKAKPGIGIVGGLCLATVMFTIKKIGTITKLCRRGVDIIVNHVNGDVRRI
jgi:hypothetical protein